MTDKSALVHSLYDAFGRGDLNAILDALDPSIDWISSTNDESIPWRGKFKGIEGVAAFFRALGDPLDFEAFEPRRFLVSSESESLIVLGRTHARVKSTGKRFDSEWAHVFSFKGDKLDRFQEFYDTAAIAAAFVA